MTLTTIAAGIVIIGISALLELNNKEYEKEMKQKGFEKA